jgi:hypothetical protein
MFERKQFGEVLEIPEITFLDEQGLKVLVSHKERDCRSW